VIRAFAKLKAEHSNLNIELHIAGEGPLRGSLELAAGVLFNKSVFLHGKIDHSNMPDFYRDKHVLFNLSHFESFGVSVLEASAMGLAVVASNRGGLPEVVQHGNTGYLLEDPGEESVAETMLNLAEHPDIAAEMGRNGRIFVQSHFEYIQNVQLQIDAYRQMLIKWKSGK
jgi:glycosyltransferase involved in cell wall biosynthesis